MLSVIADSMYADRQPFRNLLASAAMSNQLQHFTFSLCQPVVWHSENRTTQSAFL